MNTILDLSIMTKEQRFTRMRIWYYHVVRDFLQFYFTIKKIIKKLMTLQI